ncbi:hypothetical protein B0I08_102102 [Glaciihabitans tibetensis]|uniref:Uncharacterized protein n=1 Tax=Glaciihabitans tibetensis TaxID=1266600 RepID=A0A2T0VGV2_9MICO|nr:hypothetical protein B0I08_102102 [Glaciihabitans tibetensis]
MTIAITLVTVLSVVAIYSTVVSVARDGYHRIPTRRA